LLATAVMSILGPGMAKCLLYLRRHVCQEDY